MPNPYFTCVLDAWRDGKTLYGRMHYYRSGSYLYTDYSFPTPTMNLGGTVYYDNDFANRVHNGIYVGDVYSTTFSRTVAGTGDRTVTWSAGSGGRSDFEGTWSKTVNFPEEYTAPTGLGCDNITRGIEDFSARVYLSGWGNNSGTGTKYRELQVWTQGMTEPRRYQTQTGSSLSGVITCGNSSSGSLTIRGNTTYTLGLYATNGNKNTGSVRVGDYTTRAYAPAMSFKSLDGDTATFNYSLLADGGKYAKDVQYSLDNGTTWVTVTTVSTGSATTGDFTISNLSPDTSYVIKTRVSTNAGITAGNDVAFNTYTKPKTYGPVENEAEAISKLYFSTNNKSKIMDKLYGPDENGRAKVIYKKRPTLL